MSAYRYAITDIHGCAQTFRALVTSGIELTKKDQLFLLGDYIDRGPDSKGVFDFIFELKSEGYQVHCLKGNHEEMMLRSLTSETQNSHWKRHGGTTTLNSFGVQTVQSIPGRYIEFIRSLDHYHLLEDYILVHAGLNFRSSAPLEDTESMLWIRPWDVQVDLEWLAGRIILHGHTPVDQGVIEYQLAHRQEIGLLDLDNGCFRTAEPGKGQLCAFNLDTQALFFQPNIDT
ncbi:MAG: metallophosphoesterase family protein [Bacteroidota bacterium]